MAARQNTTTEGGEMKQLPMWQKGNNEINSNFARQAISDLIDRGHVTMKIGRKYITYVSHGSCPFNWTMWLRMLKGGESFGTIHTEHGVRFRKG